MACLENVNIRLVTNCQIWQIMGMPKMETFGTLTPEIAYEKYPKWHFYWASLLITRNGYEFCFYYNWQFWDTLYKFSQFWKYWGVQSVAKIGNQTYLEAISCRLR